MSLPAPTAFVIDDDPTIGLLLAQILRRNGYDTYAYTNPVIALERAKHVPPNLLICDVFMPGEITGIDVAIEVKAMHPDTKVLILSALTEIDETTQQNAGMAEEATAACQSLSQQCAELGQLVGKFRLRDVPAGFERGSAQAASFRRTAA